MKTIDIDIDGQVFKIQENLSFTQQNTFISIMESYYDTRTKKMKEGKSFLGLNSEISTYLLTHVVVEPKITPEMLDDPDDSNVANYMVLGLKLTEAASKYIKKVKRLKRQPRKS